MITIVQAVILLGKSKLVTFAERLKLDARSNGQVLRGPEQVGIKADGCADATRLQYVRNPKAR